MSTVARFNWVDENGTEHKNDIRWDEATKGFAMCSGYEEYAQTIEAVVKTVKGELTTQRDYGIPYFTTIFYDKRHNDIWEGSVRELVSELPFVREISSFEYEYDAEKEHLAYTLKVVVSDGTEIVVFG